MYQNEAHSARLQKSVFRGHPGSSDPKLGGICGHLESKAKKFQIKTNNITQRSTCSLDYEKGVLEAT